MGDLTRARLPDPRHCTSNQRGQIHIIILVVLVVGFILYANFSGGGFLKKLFPSSSFSEKPAADKEGKISAPPKAEKKLVPSPALTPQAVSAPELSDTVPPKRSKAQPTGGLPAETRKTTLGLETDEKATCKYSDETSGIHYDSMQGEFDQIDSTTHAVLITTLSEGGKYKYYVKCRDEKGNKNTDDFTISFEVKLPVDKTPPVLTNPSHQGSILSIDAKEVVISISTDEPASCRYSGSMSGNFSAYDQTKRFHVKKITGLQAGKAYDFFVRCKDSAGNANTGDVLISFMVGQ